MHPVNFTRRGGGDTLKAIIAATLIEIKSGISEKKLIRYPMGINGLIACPVFELKVGFAWLFIMTNSPSKSTKREKVSPSPFQIIKKKQKYSLNY